MAFRAADVFGNRREFSTPVAAARRILTQIVVGATGVAAMACSDNATIFAPRTQLKSNVALPSLHANRVSSARLPDQYIVTFKKEVIDVSGTAREMISQAGGAHLFTYTAALHGFAARMSAQAAEALSHNPNVAAIEQDQTVTATDVQTYTPSWGIDRIDQATLPLDGQYTYSANGSGVNAYIIDSGIRRTHTQFTGRALSGFTSINDGYGTDDCLWHGTHVAGTVGGATVGVAKAVTLYAVRVLDCNGSGSTSGVIAGVDWVTANRRLPAVANMSLIGDYSDALNTAVQNSINSGVTYVVAAGNAATNACGYSPSSLPSAITVGATTAADEQASYSNFGSCLDLYAPGTSITSAWSAYDDGLVKASGTSMASPHVAGAAALYLQLHPAASAAEVSQTLLAGATTNAVLLLGVGSPNRLLRVNGPASGTILPAPTPAPAPAPINKPPVAAFTVSCPSQKNNCSFDASSSSDDTRIVSYAWSFGDGATTLNAATPSATHSYSSKGTYTVTLTVTDDGGLSSSAAKSLSVKSISNR